MEKNIKIGVILMITTILLIVGYTYYKVNPVNTSITVAQNHIKILQEHIKNMDTLFNELSNANETIRDMIIQQLTMQRNSFNKLLCASLSNKGKKIIGFYVYKADESEAALEKIKEHLEQIKKQADVEQEFIKEINNQNDTSEHLTQIIDDFNKKQCNTVNFGYIANK